MDIVTFGEAMVRLSPPGFQRVEQTTSFDARIGGAELNVAVAVSRLGLRSSWISRLTDNPLGWMIRNEARKHGVVTDHIIWTPDDRVGLYFVEFGASPRATSVVYDRAHSAMADIRGGMVDWSGVLDGARLLHCSGITPALSDSAAQVTLDALKAAKAAGCRVSYDLNYRGKLWSREKAREVQTPMMKYVDVFITSLEDTSQILGIQGDAGAADAYAYAGEQLAERFGMEAVAFTQRESPSVWRNSWGALAWHDGQVLTGPRYDVEIVDRVGTGDAFTAGFLFGYLTGGVERGLQYGSALGALAHSVPGDFLYATREEAEALLRGEGLRIRR